MGAKVPCPMDQRKFRPAGSQRPPCLLQQLEDAHEMGMIDVIALAQKHRPGSGKPRLVRTIGSLARYMWDSTSR